MSLSAKRVELSLPFEADGLPDPERVVPVFHGVIRDKKLPEVWVDVARYAHVGHGPVVLLVGHEADFALELEAEGARLGRIRKRGSDALLDRALLRELLQMAELLETELPGVRLRTDQLRLRFLDRLRVPHAPEVVAAVIREVRELAAGLLGPVEVSALGDVREPVTLDLSRTPNPSVSALLRTLSS